MKKRILSLVLAAVMILGCLVVPASAGAGSSRLHSIQRAQMTKAPVMGDCYVYPAASSFDATVLKGGSFVLQFKQNKPTPRADDRFFVEIFTGPDYALMEGNEEPELVEVREYKMSQFTAPGKMLGMSWVADDRYPVGVYTMVCGVESASGELYDQWYYFAQLHVMAQPQPMTGMEIYTIDDGEIEYAEAVYVNVGESALVMPGRVPANSTSTEPWTASIGQPAIASVSMDAGYLYIKGLSTGITTINLKCGKIAVQFPLTVGVLNDFSMRGTTATLCLGRTDKITVEADAGHNPVYYEWTTSDPKVATVKDGVVTAVSPGTVRISATAYRITHTLIYTVDYHKLPEGTPVSERTATMPKMAVGHCSVCGTDNAINVYEAAVFTDTVYNAWYAPHVDFVYDNELMNGVGQRSFAPDRPMTRAMVATVLYRIAGSPETGGKSPFTDVPDGQWYSDAIAWAAENGIVTGYGNGIFRPDQNITREQFATILYRYTASREVLMDDTGDLSVFPDASRVQDYAREAMRWAVATGLINGVANGSVSELKPQNNTTRAQFATIVSRYQAIEWQPGQEEPGFPLEPVG